MRLSTHDASFLYSESASGQMHGVTLTIVDGDLSFDDYYAHIAARIHLVPRLRQRLVFVPGNLAHPKWVDDPHFDLQNHIKRQPLPADASLEEAADIALALGEPLLDRTRPLWVHYVLENVEGQTVLAQLAHHAMIDGASYVQMGTLLMDTEARAPSPPPAPPWRPAALPTPNELWLEALADNAAAAATALLTPGNTSTTQQALTAQGNAVMQRLATEPAITAPWNATTVGPKRALAWLPYKLEQFKDIRRALGGTINDVALTVVSEAAARYLKLHDEPVDKGFLRLMCPVDVRAEGDTDIGNKVSAFYPRLPAWPMSLKQRHAAVTQEMGALKERDEASAVNELNQTTAELPPMLMAATLAVGSAFDPTALAAQFPAPVPPKGAPRPPLIGFNFTLSNVPGVAAQQYICGHKTVLFTGTLMLSGTLGYGVTVGSAGGNMVFNLTADPRLLPDLQVMKQQVAEVFSELVALAEDSTS